MPRRLVVESKAGAVMADLDQAFAELDPFERLGACGCFRRPRRRVRGLERIARQQVLDIGQISS